MLAYRLLVRKAVTEIQQMRITEGKFMNPLAQTMDRKGLKKAVIALSLLAALGLLGLFAGTASCITSLNAGQVREALDNESRLLWMATTGASLSSLALGMSVMSIYFLWRTGLQRNTPPAHLA